MNSRILPRKSDDDTLKSHHDRHIQSMEKPMPSRQKRVSRLERWLLTRMLNAMGDPEIALVLWNGEVISAAGDTAKSRVTIRDRKTLWQLVFDPGFQFGEAYTEGRLDVSGEMYDLIQEINRVFFRNHQSWKYYHWLNRYLHTPRRNTLSGSQQNIHRHYDIGNDFYKLWLDEQLLYTCAYFPDSSCTLEEAQIAKMDHVCRKLQLQPGQSVIEAGCGWGALALHMARHYGVTVKAYNISHEQIASARDRARAEGLQERVEFIEDDWRNITGECDVFASVGMLEHVGRKNYQQLGDVIDRCLSKNGFGLIHTIGQIKPRPFDGWTERRIFPGAYPPTLREMMDIFEPNLFSVLDVENLRLHYAETVRHWLSRFEESVDTVREMFDERFVRMWRLYLASSVSAFESGNLQLFQVVFSRGNSNTIPRTRNHLYTPEGHSRDRFLNSPVSQIQQFCSDDSETENSVS